LKSHEKKCKNKQGRPCHYNHNINLSLAGHEQQIAKAAATLRFAFCSEIHIINVEAEETNTAISYPQPQVLFRLLYLLF
jgi:hypothetical protein